MFWEQPINAPNTWEMLLSLKNPLAPVTGFSEGQLGEEEEGWP